MSELARLDSEVTEEDYSVVLEHKPEEQYLTFFMDNEEYGVDILSVQEIRGWEASTPIPNVPRWVKGVINLRGSVVPIIDIRQRFGILNISYIDTTVVIVVRAETSQGIKIMGIVVDAVSDVYNFPAANIHASPELSENTHAQFIKGIGTADDKMVILLDICALLDANNESEFSTLFL